MSTISLQTKPSSKGNLIKIGDAARKLFVSEQTLRDWTDQDKIIAYTTEGGHRNYYEADIQRLAYENKQITGFYRLTGIISINADGATNFEADLSNGKYSDIQKVEWAKFWDYRNGLEKQAHQLALTGEPVIFTGEAYASGDIMYVGSSSLALTKEEALNLISKTTEQAKETVFTKYVPQQVTRWVDKETNQPAPSSEA